MTKTFLPAIHSNAPVTGQGEMDARAEAFAEAWLALLPEARRNIMRFDSRLAACAQSHAEYLAQRTGDELLQSMHRGEGGSYPNSRVIAAGYMLPSGPNGYDPFKNNVESCARDSRDSATVAVSLANHEPHRQHMLGLPGFEDRTVWGIGVSGDDWVFLACPPEPS